MWLNNLIAFLQKKRKKKREKKRKIMKIFPTNKRHRKERVIYFIFL